MVSTDASTFVNINSTPAAYIMSHSTFNFGQKLHQFNIAHQLLLFSELTNTTVVKIEFLYIDIACASSYNNNTGFIASIGGTEPRFKFTCYSLKSAKSTTPLVLSIHLKANKNPLRSFIGLFFKINNDTRRGGYLLKYSGMFFSNMFHYKLLIKGLVVMQMHYSA